MIIIICAIHYFCIVLQIIVVDLVICHSIYSNWYDKQQLFSSRHIINADGVLVSCIMC